ncbi:MAG: N-acetyltransferase family protein [Ktedonobacterales bacterium]
MPTHPNALRAVPSHGAWPVRTNVRLSDGAVVSLHEAGAEGRRLRELFYTLSDTTRYLYFGIAVPRSATWAERVAQLGTARGCASYALVAEAAGRLVGVARFDRVATGSRAEIGVLLTDAWQSRGLGQAVVAHLQSEARRRALTGFIALVQGENRRALRLLRRAFPTMRAEWSLGQCTLDMPFEPELTVTRDR